MKQVPPVDVEGGVTREIFERFTPMEVRTMSLMALGWLDTQIKERISRAYRREWRDDIVDLCMKKTGLQRLGTGMFYVDYLLPFDMEPGYLTPGKKLEEWRTTAQLRRQQLLDARFASVRYAAVMQQAVPENVDLDDAALGLLMPSPIVATTFAVYVSSISAELRRIFKADQKSRRFYRRPLSPLLPRGRSRLLTVARLAPLWPPTE